MQLEEFVISSPALNFLNFSKSDTYPDFWSGELYLFCLMNYNKMSILYVSKNIERFCSNQGKKYCVTEICWKCKLITIFFLSNKQASLSIGRSQIYPFLCLFFSFSQIDLQHYCFLVFFVICIAVALYIMIVVPETKNKSFVEIQNEFQSSKKKNVSGSDGAGTTLISTCLWNVPVSLLLTEKK